MSHYDEHARDEAALRGTLWLGALFLIRQLPAQLSFMNQAGVRVRFSTAVAIRAGRADLIINTTWWRGIWASVERRAAEALARISRRSSLPLIRQFAAQLGAFTDAATVAVAREFAAAEITRLAALTAEGLRDALFSAPAGLPSGQLRRLIGDRLGPTPLQMEKILRWERDAIAAEELTRKQILSEVRARARRASILRADVFASDAMVKTATEGRVAVFQAAGVLVYSGNAGDDRVRDLHKTQTAVTRADPRVAGLGWSPSAPFQNLPPYEVRCRCFVQPAAGVEDAGPIVP